MTKTLEQEEAELRQREEQERIKAFEDEQNRQIEALRQIKAMQARER